ncbi:MAG TPA: glycosyltransferase family 39 protein [Gaiellaceae bacterium]|nr:glycosyltransferase family 39 protein [Gaiellaceae bacterium]
MTAGQVAARARSLRLDDALEARWTTPALLVVLTGISLAVRTRELGAGFWIDEGISVGIAHHHLSSIPHLLRQDGSPPLYYLLLGVWIRLFGDGVQATHVLSLLCALACIPLAYVVGRRAFDRLTGWCCAILAAFNPFLTYYGQETRMYALVALLSLVAVLAYVEGVLRGKRRWLPVLSLALAAMVYSHNWSLFFCVGLAAATAIAARDRFRELLYAGAGTLLLYLPWIPTILFQAKHTGAPWATSPSVHDLIVAPGTVLPDDGALAAFVLVGCAALWRTLRHRHDDERRTIVTLALASVVAICIAWVLSFATPEWTARYFASLVAPLLLIAGRGLVRADRLGVLALAVIVFFWIGPQKDNKENARQIAAQIAPALHPGELVVSTQPEQVPVFRYYLGAGYRFATPIGPVPDPRIFDWRDAVTRLRAAQPKPTLDALLRTVRPGQRFVVVSPVFRSYQAWRATWTKLVWRRSGELRTLLARDPRVRLVGHAWTNEVAVHENYFKLMQAFVYERLR